MIPALLSGIEAIGSMGLKKAATQGAKGIVKGKAKDFITGKGRKKKTDAKVGKKKEKGSSYSNPGQIVVAGSTGIVPSTPMVGELSTEVKSTQSTPKKVSIESLTLQLENIVGLTKTLEKITKKSYKTQKKIVRKARTEKEKEKKREREEKRESLFGKAGKGALGIAKKIDNKFNILNFFTQILLGSLVLAIVNNLPKIEAAFKWIGGNLSKVYFGVRLLLETFKVAGKGLLKVFTGGPKAIFQSATKGIGGAFKAVGNLFVKVFKGIGNFALNLAKRVLGIKPTPGKPGPGKPGKGPNVGPGRTPPKGTPSRFGRTALGNRLAGARFDARLAIKSAIKGTGSKIATSRVGNTLAKASFDARLATKGVVKGGSQFLTKAGKLTKAAGGAVKAVAKGFGRIPIIGPLIVALSSYLAGDPMDQTLFKTFGAAIGGFIGTFVPLPGISTILGGLIGEYVGDLAYTLLRSDGEGGVEALGKRLEEDIKSALQVGKVAMDWVSDGFSRFYSEVPKFKMPDLGFANAAVYGPINLLLGATTGKKIQDIELPNPFWLLNPDPREKAKVLSKAFFSRDPMDGSEVKEVPSEEESEPKKLLSENEYYNERVLNDSLPSTYEEYKSEFEGNQVNPPAEVERSSEVGEIIPIPKPKRSDFGKGRTGAKQYEKAMKSYNEQPKAEPQAAKVEPQETKIPGMTDKSKQVMDTYTELSTDSTGANITPPSEQRSSDTMDTVEKPQPAEITSPPKPSVSAGVESQASYEGGGHCCCCDDESVSVLPPPAEPAVSGGGSGGGGGSFSGGNVLNSLLKQQVLGFLYKQG